MQLCTPVEKGLSRRGLPLANRGKVRNGSERSPQGWHWPLAQVRKRNREEEVRIPYHSTTPFDHVTYSLSIYPYTIVLNTRTSLYLYTLIIYVVPRRLLARRPFRTLVRSYQICVRAYTVKKKLKKNCMVFNSQWLTGTITTQIFWPDINLKHVFGRLKKPFWKADFASLKLEWFIAKCVLTFCSQKVYSYRHIRDICNRELMVR